MNKDTNLQAGQPIIAQLLNYIPKDLVQQAVTGFKSDHYYKKVKTWDQLVFMVYAVLTGSSTLREVTLNLGLLSTKLSYLNLTQIPCRSSISDANTKRTSLVFGSIYIALYMKYKNFLSDSYLFLPINGEVLPSQVEVFDATTITLFKDVFKACGRMPHDGRRKGGIKAFTRITLSERVPNLIYLKSASTNDRDFLKMMDLPANTIAVFDKGFHNYKLYEQWNKTLRFYVTRLNDNAVYDVVRVRPLGDEVHSGVRKDCDIVLHYKDKKSGEIVSVAARCVTYIDPIKGEELVFLTNAFTLKSFTICLLYKNRWTIEPLYKQIKQNFEVNNFLSDSAEGIKTQIWIAMILNLIFTVISKQIKEAQDFSTMVKVAAKNTGSYVCFIKFLEDPLQAKKLAIHAKLKTSQLNLFENIEGGAFFNSE